MEETILEATGTDNLALLKYAIKNKYEIRFWYYGVEARKKKEAKAKSGTKMNWREVQPVSIGEHEKTGNPILRGWQRMGTTNTEIPAWKTFRLDQIKPGSITVFDGQDGSYYRPFQLPDADFTAGAPKFRPKFDDKMVNSTPQLIMKPGQKIKPNKGAQTHHWVDDGRGGQKSMGPLTEPMVQMKKKRVNPKKVDAPVEEPTTQPDADEKVVDITSDVKPEVTPTKLKKIKKKENSIQNNIVKSKADDVEDDSNTAKNKTGEESPQSKPNLKKIKKKDIPPKEDPLNESSWMGWLLKIVDHG